MDRTKFISDHEPSIECLLTSMKDLLSRKKIQELFGATRSDTDFSVIDSSKYKKYDIVFQFINKMFFVPLIKGIKNTFHQLCNNYLIIIYTYLAGFDILELNSAANTHHRSSHVRIMHYGKKGKFYYISIKL